MLPVVKGTSIEAPPWRELSLQKVLQYYDGPRLVLEKTRGGQLFLAWWSDSDESIERWIYLPLSEQRLYSILSGEIPSREALSSSEDGYLFVVDKDSATDEIVKTVLTHEISSIPPDALPIEGARLNIPLPPELSGIPSRERAHLLNVKLEADPSDRSGRVGAKVVGQFIAKFQLLIEALGQTMHGNASPRGRIPEFIQRDTRLDIVGTYSGSFGIRFESHSEDDFSGESRINYALSSLFDLFDVGYDSVGLTPQIMVLERRVAKHYSSLLDTVKYHNLRVQSPLMHCQSKVQG